MTRYAHLWGGPMDGEVVWLGDGDPPARLGMHRTADGLLVPIRSRALTLGMPLVAEHVAVYERAGAAVRRLLLGDRRTYGLGTLQALSDGGLYVHADLLTRWAAQR